ncbi:MAG: PhzF family phenazine biosynthesis protein [Rhodospirillales bacterium]|nr:PhzF family phenazine biosynthesis protein [Rhodospirillales bacterium]MCW8970946.1 PhzF family phenazine biosynthesis protein [Rhodospirillales bacterium]
MKFPIYQIDAFTDRVFAGNPAAVCPLESWLPDETLQAIAAENNLSETAFFVPKGDDFELRWFTPGVEVDLCGHATLATAHLILSRLERERDEVRFHTKSGLLTVVRDGGLLSMDFPSRPPAPCAPCAGLIEALGGTPEAVLAARDYVVVYGNEDEVRALTPDMAGLMALDRFAVIATAPGRDCDFVSRFFAPAKGVPEDPVTGSAHCSLVPYWAARLGKDALDARQVSARGGAIRCRNDGDRVHLAGKAVLYMEGMASIRE